MVDYLTILGLIGASLTTFSFLPQVWKTHKTRKTRDLSLPWLLVLDSGFLIWLIYGAILQNIPLVFANVFSLAFALYLTISKMRFG